jgi:predicted DNA-binding WGR domain protein
MAKRTISTSMQRYECVTGTHSKFWTIDRAAAKVTTSWGRIGTAGQSKTKSFATDALAKKEVAKLIAEKTRGGYKAIAGSAKASKPSTPAPPAPFRNAIPAAELWTLGEQIRKHAAKPLSKDKARSDDDRWSEVPTFSERLRVYFWPDSVGRVASVRGEVCFGNVADPGNAIRIKGGGADNRMFKLLDRLSTGVMWGLRLSDEMPVRWHVQAPFVPGATWPPTPREARIGFWTPGIERKETDQFDGSTRYPSTVKGVLSWDTGPKRPVNWVLGLDAKGRPACVVVGRYLNPRVFDHGRVALGPEAGSAAKDMKAARDKVAAEEAAENPLTSASLAELTAIAAAIAAGPRKRGAKVGKRFSLSWTEAAIPAVDGSLEVGDPCGDNFEISAGGKGAKPVFMFSDEEYDVDGAVVGVRLGEGKAVQWKPSFGIGVDSGTYGVWSPGFPTDDVSPYGAQTEGALAAYILGTVNGDCGFPSLLGLDAAKKPVAFLFGEALRPDVFKLARKPLA